MFHSKQLAIDNTFHFSMNNNADPNWTMVMDVNQNQHQGNGIIYNSHAEGTYTSKVQVRYDVTRIKYNIAYFALELSCFSLKVN